MSQERESRTDDSTVVAPPLPSRIGEYVVKKRIASGGMGTVYEATHESTGKTIALKMLHPAMASTSALRRFRTESRILSKLNHPNIAQVIDAGIYDDGTGAIPYFAMEYITDAQAITNYVRANELGTREKLKLFSTVCEAVHYGNQRGIVHRDLKPSNILVDSSGKVKVIDFGVARTTDSDLTATSQVTRSGELIGTLAYMSPEQVRGRIRYIDERSDVYSLGVVLYELIADRLPYELDGLAEYEVLRAIQEQSPKRLSQFNPSIGDALETLVHTALSKDRQWRYQSADEFRQNIQRVLDQVPLVVPHPTLKHKFHTSTKSFVGRHPIVTYSFVVILSALLGEHFGVWLGGTWKVLDEWFTKTMLSKTQPVSLNQQLEHVRVIRISEDTERHIEEIAKAEGLTGVTSQYRRSWRRLHGRLMEKLAKTGVKAVTYDVRFPGTSEFDEDFVNGVTALNEAGIDVVIGVNYWGFNDGGRAGVSSNIARHVKWGTTIASPTEQNWSFHVIVNREGYDPQPALCLTCIASFLNPQHDTAFRFNADENEAVVGYYTRSDPLDPRVKEWRNETTRIPLTSIWTVTETPAFALKKGDQIGFSMIDLPTSGDLNDSTLDYESLFDMDDSDLRKAFQSKLAIIGYTFPFDDIYSTPDGRRIHGVYGHAVAIDSLLRQLPIVFISLSNFRFILLTGAILGVLIGLVARSHLLTSLFILFIALAAAVAGCIFAYVQWRCLFTPFVLLITISTAFALSTQANRFNPLLAK